jgi:diguanylate cyclase (GGDEF)-like protein/PAS domain S-box-containing protein
MKQFKLSLKQKAVIGIVVILVPILITLFLVYSKNKVYIKNNVLDTLNIIAEAYEGRVYQFLEMAKRRAEDFASDGFIRTQLQKVIRGNVSTISRLNKHLVRNKLVVDKTINTINILSLEGRVVASTNNVDIGRDFSSEAIFLEGKETVTVVEKCFGHCELTEIAIAAPILSEDTGRLIGVIVNYIPVAKLSNIIIGKYSYSLGTVSWDKGRGAWKALEIYLVNRDKHMITKSIFIKDEVWVKAVDTLPVNLCLASGKEMVGIYKDYRGIEVVGASKYIPSMKWVLLAQIDKSEVVSPIGHILISTLITVGIVIVMVVLSFIVFIKKVVKPLRRISESAKRIASGNFEVAVPAQTYDEIGVLCESFNYMANQIKTRTTELIKSEARLTEAQRIAIIGSWEWDVIKNEVFWSYEAHRIFGLTQGNFVSPFETFLNHVHPDDREFVKKSFDEALYHKKSLDIDHRIILKDATVRIVHEKAEVIFDNNGRAIQVVGATQDITERKRKEEELMEYGVLFSEVSDLTYICDAKGNIVFVNKIFEKLTGRKQEEFIGKPFEPLFDEENLKKAMDAYSRTLQGESPQYELYFKDTGILCEYKNMPIRDRQGHITGVIGTARDVTERRHIEETKTRLSEITEITTDFVGTATVDGRMLYINKAGRKIIGIGEDEDISNLKISDLHTKLANNLILNEGIPDAIREGAWIGETAFLNRDGSEIPASQVIVAHKNSDGTVGKLSIIGRDISERKRFEEQITYMMNRDPLTNLLNRRRFNEELDGWFAQARRFGIKVALLFLDLDNFKYINDSFGHQIGDKLLVTIANVLRARVRKTDVLARLGGDEFSIILIHADVNLAESVANQIRESVQHYASVEGNCPTGVTVSIGIAVFPEHGDTAEALLTCADIAMYKAKEEGRNCVRIYTPEQKTHIELRLFWENRIREALDRDNFVLLLQPIMDISKNLIIGHEVLLRMVNEKGEMELPGTFLEIAERFGLIHDIDRWVVKRAIHLIKKLQQNGKPAYLEVNISGKSFKDKKLLPLIRNELAATGIDTATLILVFEITETALIENMADAQNFITELKSIGCLFALDDFGIGFSSFNYVKQLPVDYLKIDGSFIINLPHDTTDQHLVKAMVEVARSLGKKTTAEFVGSEETLRLLREYGVDYAQGYHIGKPRNISEI